LSKVQNKYFFIKSEYIQDFVQTGVFREITSSDIEENPCDIKFIYPMKRQVDEIASRDIVVVDASDIKRCWALAAGLL
jgi:hypothetical protein